MSISQEFNAAGFNMLSNILAQVTDEVLAQDEKWGEQNHPSLRDDVASHPYVLLHEEYMKTLTDTLAKMGKLTWMDILLEEIAETISAGTEDEFRAEMIQVAAVAVNWIACIDRRRAKEREETGAGTDATG